MSQGQISCLTVSEPRLGKMSHESVVVMTGQIRDQFISLVEFKFLEMIEPKRTEFIAEGKWSILRRRMIGQVDQLS